MPPTCTWCVISATKNNYVVYACNDIFVNVTKLRTVQVFESSMGLSILFL